MKDTLLCNYYQGPFHSGTHGCHLQEAARKLADSCSDDFLAELGVGHIEDMGLPDHYVMTREDMSTRIAPPRVRLHRPYT